MRLKSSKFDQMPASKSLLGVKRVMRYKQIPVIFVASTLSMFTLNSQAYDAGYYPDNPYWQAPKNWSGSNTHPAYRQPYPPTNYPAQNVNRPAPSVQNQYRGDPPPPPGPYTGAPQGSNEGPSAFYTPGYNPNRSRNNNWNNNKYWGRSGPDTWMNPNKGNMGRGWDDMINSPSRMGRMPGGWTAPEVTMPNPVDVGDQMQDNVQDLPDQMRNMDVGN
jgi:hypothetical protein